MMLMLKYYWSKLIKKLPGSSIKDSTFEYPSKAEARCTILNSHFGRYSYCGYNCTIINSNIGRFTSIADKVIIGNAHHPIEWVSTSPAFYKGKDSIPKNLAKLDYNSTGRTTIIGNDVWIGEGAYIKDGVRIGDGAVVGMGSIVTKDIPSYAIVAGNPARIIRMRFSDDVIREFEKIMWWNMEIEDLELLADSFDNPEALLERIKQQAEQ